MDLAPSMTAMSKASKAAAVDRLSSRNIICVGDIRASMFLANL